jgi:hypothetical protein
MNDRTVCRLFDLHSMALFLIALGYLSVTPILTSSTLAQADPTNQSPAEVSDKVEVVDARGPDKNERTSILLPLTDETGEQVIGEKVCSAEPPLLMAEGSNGCEIISCGMGIKQTCKITCPAGQTPKCSCDCERSFGPICTDYKANCRCE